MSKIEFVQKNIWTGKHTAPKSIYNVGR